MTAIRASSVKLPAEAAERSSAADAYVRHLESAFPKVASIEATPDRQKRFAFSWTSPLEDAGVTHKINTLAQERGMAWMLRAACKRQEAVVAVAACPRAPLSLARHRDGGDDALRVVGGSVLRGDSASSNPNSGAARDALGNPDGTPASPGPVLGPAAVAVANALRRAAGLYKRAADGVLPACAEDLRGERPNELLPSMANAMRLLCLAEAQAVTARRAEERAAEGSRGDPESSGGDGAAEASTSASLASLSLLAKLHGGAADLYRDADLVLRDSVGDFNRVSRALQACVLLGQSLHRARAHRCVADAAFAEARVGEAVALCDQGLAALRRGAAAAGETSAWRDAWEEETFAMSEARRKYARENEVVFFEKVPDRPETPLPPGKVIVKETEPEEEKERSDGLFVE